MLHDIITIGRPQIIQRCRDSVALRSTVSPTDRGSEHRVPVFLDQVANVIRRGLSSSPEIVGTATEHGHNLAVQGFTVSDVIHDYGDVCQAITEHAAGTRAVISAVDFGVLNRCLDEAVAAAVTEYEREHDRRTIESATARGTERLGYFAHELRNLIDTSIVALEVIKLENAGVAGSTGAVLQRSLTALRALVRRSLAELRGTQSGQHVELLSVAEFVDELAPTATLDANARGIRLVVAPVEPGVAVEGDREVLAAVVGNLLQNAFKFTQPHTTVTLRVSADAERVHIEVHDQCLGLPEGNIQQLFSPFEQRSADRTGMGLGLAFSRWGAEANRGRISARNAAGKGCVFTLDLPRIRAGVTAAARPRTTSGSSMLGLEHVIEPVENVGRRPLHALDTR